MTRFSGKTVIVTGASSGIGAATARRFGAEGANVVLVARSADKLAKVAADIDSAHVVTADVGRQEDVLKVVEETRTVFGGVDVLVNNAGTVHAGGIDVLSTEDWNDTIQTDLTGVYLMTKAAWGLLKDRKGNVVNTSSVSGIGGDWNMFAYNAAKGGVSNLTRALALDARDSGVRVNAVAPAATRTEMAAGVTENKETTAKFLERIPLSRIGEPEDVAAAIVFLASADAGFINGVVLPVDGGLNASNGQPPQA